MAEPSIFPTYPPPSTFPRATPSLIPAAQSLIPAMRQSLVPVAPLRISTIPVAAPRISSLPRGSLPPRPAYPTLPPAVRAARMMGTVRKFAARLARRLPRHVDLDDLVGAGSLGLVDAFKRRNGMTGQEFEAFAAYRIRGAMLDELRRLDAVPRRSRRRAKEITLAQRLIEQRKGSTATEEEVASELGLELDAFQALRAKIDASRAPISLGGVASEDEDSVADVADTRQDGPDAIAARAQLGERILAGIDKLSDRMRLVVHAIYVEGKTLKQIGAALGVTESRACQIHGEALAQLRTMVDDEEKTAPASEKRIRAAAPKAAQGARRARRSRTA